MRQSTKQMNRCKCKNKKKWKQNYNETAVAIITIVPDDGPVWLKHVVLE
jgi:hypothetical protein